MELSPSPVASAAVVEQLERMLNSGVFKAASRSSRLLRFLVQETLNGNTDRLKDYTLGAEVLGRGDDFDPRIDPIARVEASRLRSRLELYYATEGASDPVLIALPKGGYVPRFEARPAGAPAASPGVQQARLVAPLAALIVAVVVLILAGYLWMSGRQSPAPAETHLELTTPATTDPVSLAVSPDGRMIVFVASAGGTPRLWLRRFESSTATPLPGTEHALLPFWSPDGESIGFFADSKVKRIDISTGVLRVVNRAPVAAGGAWGRGVIVHPLVPDGPLFAVSDTGRDARRITSVAEGQTGHRGPQFLPDGRHFIYHAMGTPQVRGLYVGELGGADPQRLFDADTPGVYTSGHILYVQQGTLFAIPFDASRLAVAGKPQAVAQGVTTGWAAHVAALSASTTGTIAYRIGSAGGKRQFIWFDRTGRETGRVGAPESSWRTSYGSMSPDGRRLAVQRAIEGNTDIWLLDLERSTLVRFTSGAEADIAPLWSPDGKQIVVSTQRTGVFDLVRQSSSAAVSELLLATREPKQATDWSRDGRWILFRSLASKSDWDIWALPLDAGGEAFAVVRTEFEEREGQFSPDVKWIAYQSNESGRFEIYIRSFRTDAQRMRVSSEGGVQPRWGGDGRELFYLSLDSKLTAVPVAFSANDDRARIGTPVPLFPARVGALQDVGLHLYSVTEDGQRFLLDTVVEETPAPISIVLNWRPRRSAE